MGLSKISGNRSRDQEAVADIFISYASDDNAFATRLRAGIEAAGFSVWIDAASIAGGERWTEEIESAIEDAASVVVVVSQAMDESVWVRRQVLYAQQLGKRIVPVFAEAIPLPALFIDLNASPLHDDFDAGLVGLLNDLHGQTTRRAAGEKARPVLMAKALWLSVGAAVVVGLAVIGVRCEGRFAEVLATGLAIGGALLAMTWKADEAISLVFKRDLSLWLVGLDPAAGDRSVQRWPVHFAALFDRVFGKKHLSWRCFYSSSIASLLTFLLCTLIFMQAAPREWAALAHAQGSRLFVVLGLIGALFNLLPHYVSLLETRWVIQRMQRTSSLTGQMGWLLVDFVATTAIFFLFAAGLMVVTADVGKPYLDAGLEQWSLLAPVRASELRVYVIPLWTAYFTTVWVWLYFLAQFVVRLVNRLRRILGFVQYAVPVKQRPLRAVGQMMALMACAGYYLVVLPASPLGDSTLAGPLDPEMVVIEPGEFRMGDLSGQGSFYERSVRTVAFTEPFAIGKYEVTFAEYDHFARATGRVMPNDHGWGRGKRPVINVNWDDATAYAEWLSEQTGHWYRLPTEAEWEFVARAGTETEYWWDDEIGENRANCDGCGSKWDNKQTAPVDAFEPNPWGLHDTAGNVWEWVEDCWHDNYDGEPPRDGSAWREEGCGECDLRVLRGGSWYLKPWNLRSASRYWSHIDYRGRYVGFRLAQDI